MPNFSDVSDNTCPLCRFGDRRVRHTTPLGHECVHVPDPSPAEARLLADDTEMVTVYPANEKLYGRCGTCGQIRWRTDRYRGDGAGQDTGKATHCRCCTHPHNLPPGGHTLLPGTTAAPEPVSGTSRSRPAP